MQHWAQELCVVDIQPGIRYLSTVPEDVAADGPDWAVTFPERSTTCTVGHDVGCVQQKKVRMCLAVSEAPRSRSSDPHPTTLPFGDRECNRKADCKTAY